MRLLRIALENQRWDLAAHTIVLATANLLQNGERPRADKRTPNNPGLGISGSSGIKKVTKTGGREFDRDERRS